MVGKLLAANIDAAYDSGTNTFTLKNQSPVLVSASSTSNYGSGTVSFTAATQVQPTPAVVTDHVGAGYMLIGGEGNDILFGGSGLNTLTGGTGADTFVIDKSALTEGPAMADLIMDYNAGQGDKVDLTELLGDVAGVNAGNIGSYAKIVADTSGGSGTTHALQVDVDGAGAGSTFVTVAYLTTNVGVQILYHEDQNATTTPTV